MSLKIYFALFIVISCFAASSTSEAEYECGIKPLVLSSRSFGGYRIGRNEWPWLVALMHAQLDIFFCGGSLISRKHVLSGKSKNGDQSSL